MIPASYVVIRYVADPARNEPLNVGVLAWSGSQHALSVDDDAVARVVRENPRLHPDALLSLADVIREQLDLEPRLPDSEIRERLQEHPGFPVLFTEPRFTSVADDDVEALNVTVERLVERIVHPRRRYGGAPANAMKLLERRLSPLIQRGAVHVNHLFPQTRTGVSRRVDFFVNSGANTVLDTIRLDLRRADEIRLRADAEAYKVEDILSANDVRVFLFPGFSEAEDMAEVTAEARRILSSTRATLVATLEEAGQRIEGLAVEPVG